MSEVREMLLHKAQKYLEVVRARGEARKELRRVYRIICCQELYLLAYSHLYANKGALTPGVDPDDTVDGMSMERIDTLIQRHNAVIQENIQTLYIVRNELITRLLATTCELCGKEGTTLIGHHIRKLKDLKKRWEGRKKKPEWVKKMIAIRRKTLFICSTCHSMIHSGKYDGKKLT